VKQVWRSGGGARFHARPDCESLLAGQEKAASEGMQNHPIVHVPLSSVRGEYKPCLHCWKGEPGWVNGWLQNELKVEHHSGQPDGSAWESIFLVEVLEKISTLNPAHVTAQDVVKRPYGAPLRPDFTIKVPRWQPLAIEIDGQKAKWYDDAPDAGAVLRRDDDLEQLGYRVLHFTNTQVTQETEYCRQRLERVLGELESDARERSNGGSRPATAPVAAASGMSVPGDDTARHRPWLKWALVGVAAVAVVATVVAVAQPDGGSGVEPSGSGECDSAHPVKGNQSGIYHEPGWEFYDRTNAEECFATGDEAADAGYRPSERR